MLTVNHKQVMGGEAIYEVVSLRFDPHCIEGCSNKFGPSAGILYLAFPSNNPSFTELQLKTGSVYVMNEAGKTVAKYDLGGWALPCAGDNPVG